MPTEVLPIVESCKILWRTGRRLQLIPAAGALDHVPMLLEINYTIGHYAKEEKVQKWCSTSSATRSTSAPAGWPS